MSLPPESIDCMECGGRANLVSFLPDDDEQPEESYPVAYQCPECGERYDVVWREEEED